MSKRWVYILGNILIVLGIILLMSNITYGFITAFLKGNIRGKLGSFFNIQLNGLAFLLPGLLMVGFNRVLNKLDKLEIRGDNRNKLPGYNSQEEFETKRIKTGKITNDEDEFKDYKYVSHH